MVLEDILKTLESMRINPGVFSKKIQKLYAKYVREGRTDSINEVEKITGIAAKIPEWVVQRRYIKDAEKGKTDSIKRLQEKTGIKPKLSKQTSLKAYAAFCTSHGIINADELKKLQTLTRIKLPEQFVQQGYLSYIERGEFHNWNDLEKATGIKPRISEKIIQDAYLRYLKGGYIGRITELYELTRKSLQRKTIKKALFKNRKHVNYKTLYKLLEEDGLSITLTKDCFELIYSALLKKGNTECFADTIEETGVIPSEKLVQRAYALCLKNPEEIEKLQKLTGIKPYKAQTQTISIDYLLDTYNAPLEELKKLGIDCKILKKPIQILYNTYLRKKDLSRIKRLHEMSGLKPNFKKKRIQDMYLQLIMNEQYHHFDNLQKITGVKISENTVQMGYLYFATKGDDFDYWKIEKLKRKTGIEISKDIAHKVMSYYLKKGHIYYFKYLQETIGIKPSKEEYKMLVRQLISNK